MVINKSDQRIELIKSNQGIVWIKLSQDIQSWNIGRYSIMTDYVKLNHV